ncbi:MAG: peptidylprolyl isomerase [Clostridia bacterium]|nr:peptidylprolyl isomerase [Clostridia bacterium]
MKRWICALLVLALAMALAGCGRRQEEDEEPAPNPVATINLGDGSQMRIELRPDIAPNTVYNFIQLANDGFYNNREIFRVVSNVFIQTGDPNDNGTGDPGYYIKGEFSANDFPNSLSHMRGTVSMARKADYDTGGSQFFIMEGSYPEYDGYYAAFGTIADEASMNVLDEIGSRPVDGSYVPLDRIYIRSIHVETFEVEYPEPEKLKKSDIDDRKEGKRK